MNRTLQFDSLEPRRMTAAIAFIDSGVDLRHYRSDSYVAGWDFTDGNRHPVDYSVTKHGSSVIDAALRIAPDAGIVALRIFDSQGRGSFGLANEALEWIEVHHAEYDIVSVTCSFGIGGNFTTVPDFPADLERNLSDVRQLGVTVVAAAGNGFTGTVGATYPGISRHVICAMASNGDALQPFSQRIEKGHAMDGSSTSRVAGAAAAAVYVVQTESERRLTVREVKSLFNATCDWLRDEATGLRYRKINLESVRAAL